MISDPNEAERVLDRVIALERQSQLVGQAYLQLATSHRRQGKNELAAHDLDEYKRIQSVTSKPE